MIARREFITLLGGAAAAWPMAGTAQQGEKLRRIGIVLAGSERDAEAQGYAGTMRESLRELGWTEGHNVQFECRWAGADPTRMERSAREVVGLRPDLILSATTPITLALQQATRNIPIVFVVVSDPVGDGIVRSLSHPGGNITGFINVEAAMAGKWVELLKEIAPNIRRIAALLNPETAPGHGTYFLPLFEVAAASLKLDAITAVAHSSADIERIMERLGGEPQAGLVILPGGSFATTNRKLIISLSERHNIPTIYQQRLPTTEGGLISYGANYTDLYRRAASYADRILRGESPADLPVQVPAKYELVINLKTAKSLGLTVPPTLLATANEVIE